MQKTLIKHIADQENLHLQSIETLSGGDINEVFLLHTSSGKQVIKINSAKKFPFMFQREAEGLDLLRSTHSFRIPKIYGYGQQAQYAYLLLEYISPAAPTDDFWKSFAKKLGQLHQSSSSHFGLATNNYIGSLQQFNQSNAKTSAEFYIESRLKPQFALAAENGFVFKDLEHFYQSLLSFLPDEKPSLLHGDLWNGNQFCSTQNQPVLIDPAISYGSREMDLAMMQLFGGFPSEVFAYYHQLFPLEENYKNRIPIWQLYYLLVHLNLFGQSYLPSVKRILDTYKI